MMTIKKGIPYPFGARLMADGVHFATAFEDPFDAGIILYQKSGDKITTERIQMKPEYFVGNIGCVIVDGIDPENTYYNFYEGEKVYLDPHARGIVGREKYGADPTARSQSMCAIPTSSFDWEDDSPLCIPYEESVFYCLHVRGFSNGKRSGVKTGHKGTFAGIIDKIPYFKELGVKNLELMPVYEYDEWDSFVTVDANSEVPKDIVQYKMNYWGYKEAAFFAPKRSYSSQNNSADEFKSMVRSAHENGIEIILQMYFPDSIKPGYILEVLRFWVMEYHVDGFHLMGNRIPLTLLGTEPMFSNTKLIYYGFPVEEIYKPSELPKFLNLGVFTEDFQIAARKFLKGDENMLSEMMQKMTSLQTRCANFRNITNYYGFTLTDLVSYDRKHNADNGEDNRDGADLNYSWNCGEEGDSKKSLVKKTRKKQLRNAMAIAILSQGTPFLMAGDEDLNSQDGNNNPYCQDNEIGYKDWNHTKASIAQFEFVQGLLKLRAKHPTLRKGHLQIPTISGSSEFPEISFHSDEAFSLNTAAYNRHIGIMYGGLYGDRKGNLDEDVFVAFNMHWLDQKMALPAPGKNYEWVKVLDTSDEQAFEEKKIEELIQTMPGRTVQMYVRRKK
ncbi:MAG: hypothetical protein KBS85_03015 [Lachnospiraceae bacterium]|nr:hypothetical protein [Candidatus Merdinaster equi]